MANARNRSNLMTKVRVNGATLTEVEEIKDREEVFVAVSNLSGDKAPGPDGFTMAFWQVGAKDLKDFRQISLVRGLYKLLAKVLANRLKKVVGKVVSNFQYAFIEERKILDAVLIASKAIELRLKTNLFDLILKMNIEKAYDHVNWNFLLAIMSTNESSKGLREGNPLSHHLFILAMESLNQMLYRAKIGGFILNFKLAISGLKINMEKSEIIPTGGVANVEDFALVLGYRIGKLPTSYLGFPLGAPFKSSRIWDAMKERFKKRPAMWKRQFLSKGGRLTIVKSILSSLSIYYMSLYVILSKVSLRLEKIQRNFLWEGEAFEKMPHLVNWKIVRLGKKDGRLKIRNLSILNKALLGKWN
ncbi:putative ribonuclease H protein [Vitis vinifera]|uniref:Putative ribonuclease H protein n=1 Tax=Vitis vinifera TaxID=29760 RepID=A0A438JZJ6_VITVI|nr:putative ribonuclease H protein [Vitis vinifera]